MRTVLLALLLLPPASHAGAAEAAEGFQNVVVQRGDTLWGIATKYLENPSNWDQILKYNRLPSSDPTVALPGMVLRVPIKIIRKELRAAHLIYMINKVTYRRKETAEWKAGTEGMELFRGDSLRTQDASKAKVRFLNADLLSLDPNSLAVIKPIHEDYDVELKTGGLFVGKSRVVTASARITPKTPDTQYSARVKNDLTTLVEVYTGAAAVEGQGKTVDVKAGMSSEIKLGLAPSVPIKIADQIAFYDRAKDFNNDLVSGRARVTVGKGAALSAGMNADDINNAADSSGLRSEVINLRLGEPIMAYRVQASKSRTDFTSRDNVVFDKRYDPDTKIDLAYENLQPGVYWFRIALIDLLGVEQPFSAPRAYSVGLGKGMREAGVDLKTHLLLTKPAGDEDVAADTYYVKGRVTADNLTVSVNGKTVRQDEDGNFSADVRLSDGPNTIEVKVSDAAGNSATTSRRVTMHGRYGGF